MSTSTSPKKPQSSYFYFSKDKRAEFKQKFPSHSQQEITKELAKAFKSLPAEERKVWDDMAEK
jgi:hypothetical protein